MMRALILWLGTMLKMVFKLVWKWRGHETIRILLWKITTKVLITNLFRRHRHLTQDDLCPICGLEVESILHALRDCDDAQCLWRSLVPCGLGSEFNNLDLEHWIIWNMKNSLGSFDLKD
ncbi:hypothetical protein RIF29_03905 [Crotalaria pallida]|uniref:Reverse transcriptase zinc-binding domain-containing protein n=1 Tax=Crotalaria pallida TaxID=3830 RepID=A0AAN9J1F4_CROPI